MEGKSTMVEEKKEETGPDVLSAEQLRMNALQHKLSEMERENKLKERAEKEHAKFADEFFREHVSEKEREAIRSIVAQAVRDGKMEALVYSFPSDFCSDSGRAINSGQPDWPETLQGKAKELYDSFMKVAKPKGYRLKAMVINFPGGVPGDIGLFLNWEAPVA